MSPSLVYLLTILYTLCSLCNATRKTSPNIIFILMDDIGWNDVSFNGGQFPTPNIDSLHSNSVSLKKHYIHLMCSPSRSQFLTGRYAMYNGYGQMLPWDYTEIGGIPVGQPTIASYLKTIGGYTTYAVGKWHLGYSSDVLLPTNRGFDHFYGFYQGAIHYDNLKYIDIKYGDSNHFDFWEDGLQMTELTASIGKRQQSIMESQNRLDFRFSAYSTASIYDDNTMYLYRDKIIQYIGDHQISSVLNKKKKKHDPFYMYLALQTIHGPLNEVPEKINECKGILPIDATMRRQKYCQNMLLTDDVIGDILKKLKEDESMWSNTLVVFTADNGGDVSNKGCNYPLRGTKGTLFDGNLRTIALISGGIIPQEQRGTTRDVLFSSLDWTPTLLKYANVLNKLEKQEMKWDGENQYDLIMYGMDTDKENKKRDHIVMNIGTRSLDSASIVFEYDDSLYKYIAKRDDIDRWSYIRDDGWCIVDGNGNFGLVLDDAVSLAQDVDDRYLFELSSDIAEKTNLLQLDDHEDIVDYAKGILKGYTEHYLYSEPLKFLWNRLPAGNPDESGDGSFVAPFLSNDEYVQHLRKGFKGIDNEYQTEADEQGVDVHDITPYSRALQALFFVPWTVSTESSEAVEMVVVSDVALSAVVMHSVFNNWLLSLLVVFCIAIYCVYFKYYGKDGYQTIKGMDGYDMSDV